MCVYIYYIYIYIYIYISIYIYIYIYIIYNTSIHQSIALLKVMIDILYSYS